MTLIDVIIKGTDDDASSGFFHLKVSLRHRLKKTSPCLTSPRASAEPLRACPAGSRLSRYPAGLSRDAGSSSFFESSVFIIKEATHPLLRRLRESKRRRAGFGGLRPPNTS
ncbi:hypothetical protein [Salisediminibacterium halotolerans]|uniref:hypothetical protein n=1 Tax=Salisediminibacterium halotolerans TaxID=517425 RepID=UPI001315A44A|nr:hypothetical protein [Salisediminibacterium halotolerans]